MTKKNPLEKVFDDLAKKIGKKAEMDDVTLTADFAADTEVNDGDDVLLSGRLFHVGEYKDQAFSMTPLELHAAIQAFAGPVPMNLHHQSSLFGNADLSGAFGQIEEVWPDDTGEWMMAKARKPKWLHEVMPATKVSAEFNRANKTLRAAAWTHDPIVPEAELVAAFAKHSTPTGQFHMQNIHDATVRGGAVCNKPAAMASRHENNAIQQAHDIAVQHGAQCETGQSMPMFSNPPIRRKKMGLRELLKGTLTAQGEEVDDAELDALFARDDSKVSTLEAKQIALEAENERLRAAQDQHNANFARMEAESRETAAANFANTQIAAKRIIPASGEALKSLAAAVSKSDSTATFADGEKSQTALLQEFIDSLPDLSVFTTNMVKDAQFAILAGTEKTKGVGDEEVREDVLKKMRAATPQGRQIDKENGNHA